MSELSHVKKPLEELDERAVRISDKLKRLRLEKGFKSYEKFAWANDLNRVQYWRMEKGQNFTISSLLKVLDVHKISMSDFFSDLD